MDTIISNSDEETEKIAASYAKQLKPGVVIGLSGDLGAGKTCWVRGLVKGLGGKDRVHSPTFALLNLYEKCSIPVAHLDLYRLESVEEILGAGLESYLLSPNGITIVEWIERWPDFAPPASILYKKIFIEVLSESQRRISFSEEQVGNERNLA